MQYHATGGRVGLKEGTGSKKPYGRGIESAIRQIDPLQSALNELKAGGGGIPMLGFSRLEKSFLFKISFSAQTAIERTRSELSLSNKVISLK